MPKQIDQRLMQAMNAIAGGQPQQAASLCNLVLSERKRDDLAMALLAQAYNSMGKYDDAIQLIQVAISKNNKRADYHGLLGDMLTTRGEFRKAISAYDKALKLNPDHHGVIAGKANTWLRLNEPNKARLLVETIIKKGNEDLSIAIVYAKTLLADEKPDDAADALLGHLPADQEPLETRRTLYFTLGKAMENAGEYKNAIEAYEEGNKLSVSGFNIDTCVQKHDDIIKTFSDNIDVANNNSYEDCSNRVFIVGMLRSGSTLTEQIIDAHPMGRGLGELETLPKLINDMLGGASILKSWGQWTADQRKSIVVQYLQQTNCKTNESVLVDKQLGNYQFVGIIHALFPRAKIIHCTRNPMSMGLSCFAQKFPPFTNPWASNFRDIGHFYNEYARLMRHWQDLLGENMLEIKYEDLVSNQEQMTRTILNFCDLDFNERCLRFWETGRTVLTLSQDQVRKPMYESSIARHERFGVLLDPLKNSLGIDP
ncbi:MAG: sulfotransferase [Planctomycetota bacterium]|nr:sulfotransferase [Planctomycetota bacterium]